MSESPMKLKDARFLALPSAVALLTFLAEPGTVHAKNIKSSKEWTGQIADLKKEKDWPNATAITKKEDFAKLWKSWMGEKEVPEVDFEKQLVLVSTQKIGQTHDLLLVETSKGVYVSTGSIEAKRIKGFTFALAVFNRAGIKSINGKPLR